MGATTLNLIHYQTAPLGMMTLDPAHLKHWEGLEADATIDVHSEWTVSSVVFLKTNSFLFCFWWWW